jgi:hypothetical protein
LPPVVEALQALRGVPCTVAVPTVAALGDLTRFDKPRARMKCLGLIPSEYAPGERRRPGAMTTAGNTPARRALVAGAWAYRSPAKGSRPRHLRWAKLPKPLPDISWQAQVRLCKRYRRLSARGTPANQVVVAIARALVGCMGAMATQVPITPSGRVTACHCTPNFEGCQRPSEETPPRGGVALDGVKRRKETLVPRSRQAPDGPKEGGSQPTDISVINRRSYWLRLFRCP